LTETKAIEQDSGRPARHSSDLRAAGPAKKAGKEPDTRARLLSATIKDIDRKSERKNHEGEGKQK
jgi:hypothetical protein